MCVCVSSGCISCVCVCHSENNNENNIENNNEIDKILYTPPISKIVDRSETLNTTARVSHTHTHSCVSDDNWSDMSEDIHTHTHTYTHTPKERERKRYFSNFSVSISFNIFSRSDTHTQ
eukprot:GHVR01013693.1.p3 GENE.GHVR01013693.1~~GHVR01013693.1.p3  ORF type:complete len:119 (-),score=79.70 GHVR01013693.1:239-595(-)